MKKYLPHIALSLVGLQLLLMLVSWLYSAAYPASGVHSLLSSEGIRWFFGQFADNLAHPVLVWILLLAMAWGSLTKSRLLHCGSSYRERRALWMTLILALVIIGCMALLTVVPHAVLLSVVGTLWPSPFSNSIVPVIAFSIIVLSIFYGLVSDNFNNIRNAYEALLEGISKAAGVFLFYVLVMQIYESLLFVLP